MKSRIKTLGLLLIAATAVSLACGPDFPISITTCGMPCLDRIRANPFEVEVQRLLGAPRRARAPTAETSTPDVTVFEVDGLSEAERSQLAAMRKAPNGDVAESIGGELPKAIRLYTAGAVDFRRAHPIGLDRREDASEAPPKAASPALAEAIRRFTAVTRLPSKEAAPRLTWAEYMLGRAKRLRAEGKDLGDALGHFRRVVSLVKSGASDPMHLADSALGEIAAVELSRSNTNEAIALYAQQARSSEFGSALDSLRHVAKQLIFSGETDLQPMVRNPVSQRVLTAYAVAYAAVDCEATSCQRDVLSDSSRERLKRLVTALDSLKPAELQMPGHAAALAYAVGDYPAAERFGKASKSPYGAWIRGKLALHRGDLERAAVEFAKASSGFPTVDADYRGEQSLYPENWRSNGSEAFVSDVIWRLQAESATVSLARRNYVDALDQLVHTGSRFTIDVAYIADRVLTIDELKTYVDAHFPESTSEELTSQTLRAVLARRLSRAGRYVEAVPYYPEKFRDAARRYIAAWQATVTSNPPRARAQGWYQVAEFEIRYGMELRGTALEPDFESFNGGFGGNDYAPSQLASPNERARFDESATNPFVRFHYRSVGVEHLLKAARELPKHSHEAAAVLCNGMQWLRKHSDNEALMSVVYQEFTKIGRPEPYDRNLGVGCPEAVF